MTFNVNDTIRVKLTSYGLAILKERYDEINNKRNTKTDYKHPHADSGGYSTFQLWELMATFGEYLHNGCKLPFETNILIP